MLAIILFYILDSKRKGKKRRLRKINISISYIKKYLLLITFSTFILGLSLINLLAKNKNFSIIENRYLQTKPKFTIIKFLSRDFSTQYESFVNDQFAFRDKWIDLKMLAEVATLKVENNSVIIGKDNYMFDKFVSLDEQKVVDNINHLSNFIKKNSRDKKIYFTLIPNAYELLKDKLPIGLNNINQTVYIKNIYEKLITMTNTDNFSIIDSKKYLNHPNENVFYYTDHHWTTIGAFFVYQGISQYLNYTPIKLNKLKSNLVNDFYGTHYSKAKISWKHPDVITFYEFPIISMNIENKIYYDLYDREKFTKRDKYAGFLYGNNGVVKIDTEWQTTKKESIMLIKDSYANCLVPFLTYNYNKIYVIDPRYIKINELKNIIQNNDIDQILVIYNFINFVTDNSINKLDLL